MKCYEIIVLNGNDVSRFIEFGNKKEIIEKYNNFEVVRIKEIKFNVDLNKLEKDLLELNYDSFVVSFIINKLK